MKNKLLIVFVLLLLVGCGKTEETKKQENLPLYNLVSMDKETMTDGTTRLYTVIRNTGIEDKNVKSAKLIFVDPKTNKEIYKQEKEYKHKFNVNEEMVVIFDLPVDVNSNDVNISVILSYDGKESKEESKEDILVSAAVAESKIENSDNKAKVSIDTYFAEKTKINKLKIEVYNENDKPICIAYAKVNKTVKTNKAYNYKFECDTNIGDNSSFSFKTIK